MRIEYAIIDHMMALHAFIILLTRVTILKIALIKLPCNESRPPKNDFSY